MIHTYEVTIQFTDTHGPADFGPFITEAEAEDFAVKCVEADGHVIHCVSISEVTRRQISRTTHAPLLKEVTA